MAEYYYSSKDILDKAIGTDAYFHIKSILTSTKAADVVKARHGRWVKRGCEWQCTNCKVLMSIDGTPKENLLNYCPNCGVKMDGDGDAD